MLEPVPGRIRYTELDALRGIAIVMMVLFHLVFDLSFFSLFQVDTNHGFWRIFGYATASLFVLIAGAAVALRAGRIPSTTRGVAVMLPFMKRGLLLIGVGFLVTVGTYLFLAGNGYVLFGILHLIGASTILAPLFFRLEKKVIIPGVLIVLAGWLLTIPFGPVYLLWIGIHPPGYYSVDYTPLIPWFGVFLIGMAWGFWWYPNGSRSFRVSPWCEKILRIPALPGRHSLLIYLLHQPILLVLLSLAFGKIPGI
ncbi:MAG: DUF1624 domain-containing protein [Methanospirillum sp.]|uniref:heparan-alpha-glucosaminide N-acetyltransferase n=1 Tax=Methanospirillum sp. TaxID=45200 RepID=UPI0023741660|nr:heparan-alpha-glucosaminide N-acetyltransferase [Methanospirillum sp.]MDD1729532.1 DUF1624 domain-containing protein [Methanospirillum sp.]